MFLDRRLALKTNKSYLLLGPRRVGKSTFLRHAFPKAEVIDLLKTDLYFEYRSHPELLRERYTSTNLLIVIDEAQRIPDLLHEVHWLLENSENTFVLSGSSARRLRREGVSNLAGRLSSARLFPLTYSEIPDFNLQRCLQYGCLPPILLSEDPKHDLKDYCGEYLKEEIQNEGLVRRIDSFSRFLELSALSNAQAVSYASLARDCGVATKTAREYFQILEDTLVSKRLANTRRRCLVCILAEGCLDPVAAPLFRFGHTGRSTDSCANTGIASQSEPGDRRGAIIDPDRKA